MKRNSRNEMQPTWSLIITRSRYVFRSLRNLETLLSFISTLTKNLHIIFTEMF